MRRNKYQFYILFLVVLLCVLKGCGNSEESIGKKVKKNVEKHLHQKYNEEFVAEVTWFDLENVRLYEIMAYPKKNSEIKFKILHHIEMGEGEEGYVDFYYNELYRDEINEYIYKIVKPYISDNLIDVDLYAINNKNITKETFDSYFSIKIYDKQRVDTNHIIEMCKKIHKELPLVKNLSITFSSDEDNRDIGQSFIANFEKKCFRLDDNRSSVNIEY